MKIVGNSDIGKKRTKNEDSFRFGFFKDGTSWAVVCDGMGGAAAGQVASTLTADMVSEKMQKSYNSSMPYRSIENMLLSAVTTANVTVYDCSKADKKLSGMGTTIVACVIKDSTACIAHVGDSRAYHISQGEIHQVTKDHSLVQEMLDKGQITANEIDNHPQRNIITRAIGTRETVDIDFDCVELAPDDTIILCTDGLSGSLSNESMLSIFVKSSFDDLAKELIAAANDAGGPDNITVVAMQNIGK